MLAMEKKGEEFNLSTQIKKIILLCVLIAVFPLLISHMGIDVINNCVTHTLSDVESARASLPEGSILPESGECKTDENGKNLTSDYVSVFQQVFHIYVLLLASLAFIIPGYNIIRY